MASPKILPLIQTQPRRAISHRIAFTIAVTGFPQRMPGLIVEPGLAVTMQAASGNSASLFYADRKDDLASGGNELAAGKSGGVAVDNTGQIYVSGTAGDKGFLLVSGVPIG